MQCVYSEGERVCESVMVCVCVCSERQSVCKLVMVCVCMYV